MRTLRSFWVLIFALSVAVLVSKIALYAVAANTNQALLSLGLIAVSLSIVFWSEGIQQAANLIHKADTDSISRIQPKANLSDEQTRNIQNSLLQIKESFESFLSGRQFLTLFVILIFQAQMNAMTVPDGEWVAPYFYFLSSDPTPIWFLDLYDFLFTSPYSNFAISVLIPVWVGQLLPKKFAQHRPAEFMGKIERFWAHVCIMIGRTEIGFIPEKIKDIYFWFSPQTANESTLPLSMERVFDETCRIFQPYISNRHIKIRKTRDRVLVEEQISLEFDPQYFRYGALHEFLYIHRSAGPIKSAQYKIDDNTMERLDLTEPEIQSFTAFIVEDGPSDDPNMTYESWFFFMHGSQEGVPHDEKIQAFNASFSYEIDGFLRVNSAGQHTNFYTNVSNATKSLCIEIVAEDGFSLTAASLKMVYDQHTPDNDIVNHNIPYERERKSRYIQIDYPTSGVKVALEFTAR